MGATSNQSKQLWNQERYTQVKVSVTPELAAAFKNACTVANVSMASVLAQFMAKYCHERAAKKPAPDYSTRRLRRTAVKRLTQELSRIMAAEEQYRDNIPSNLQASAPSERAEETISSLDEAYELLSAAY